LEELVTVKSLISEKFEPILREFHKLSENDIVKFDPTALELSLQRYKDSLPEKEEILLDLENSLIQIYNLIQGLYFYIISALPCLFL